MTLVPSALLRPQELRAAVKKADFSPGEIHIEATGGVARKSARKTSGPGDLVLTMPDTKQKFLLVPASKERTSKEKDHSDSLKVLQDKVSAGQRRFTIFGLVTAPVDSLPGLTVEKIVEAGDEKK